MTICMDQASSQSVLNQRTAGRRFRRRQDRMKSTGQCQEAHAKVDEDEEEGDKQERLQDEEDLVLRRPPPDVESQIEAAIEVRKQQRHALELTTRINEDDYYINEEEEEEISGNYEYLDHTADVQIHSWGEDGLESALEHLVTGMFGYMTRLSLVVIQPELEMKRVQAQAHDVESLVFAFLQEWLSLFHETGFVPKVVQVVELDREAWKITSHGKGEIFDPARHTQGTEVKAVTYSNLQVVTTEGCSRCDVWVIVDI